MKAFCLFFILQCSLVYGKDQDRVAYYLVDLDSKQVKDSSAPKQMFSLASVSKLLTTFYALKILGSDFRFETKVAMTGEVKDGVLKGNLYLIGGGDPYLTTPHLISLIHQIKSKGIKKVEGQFYLDDSQLAFTSRLSDIGQEDQADNPSMGALNVEFNRFRVLGRGKEIHPPLKNIELTNDPTPTIGNLYRLKKSDTNKEKWFVNTNEKHDYIEELPARDATNFFGEQFSFLAKLHGLQLPSYSKKKLDENTSIIGTQKSLPLYRLISLGIEYSNNLIAESILKMAAKIQTGKTLSSKESAKIMHEWFKKNFPKLNWSEITLQNGSGLGLDNMASPELIANYLKEVAYESFEGRSFWSFLSINAHSGGFKNRLLAPDYAARVYGKTGSLFFINNIAGIIITKSNHRYAYAIFSEQSKNRALLNEENPVRNKGLRSKSKEWHQQSSKFQNDLMVKWIEKY